ncbi:hypothetical protein [Nannocystis pusilla]|uniref:hypothetical protein n=1 Tax=Nannocystis pusilla TaxID=889268 RepID=UPI003B80857D
MTQKRRVVEALAVRYFKRRAGKAVHPDARDAVHFLNPDERRALRRIEYLAVGRAAIVGAVCAGSGRSPTSPCSRCSATTRAARAGAGGPSSCCSRCWPRCRWWRSSCR